MRGIFAEWIFSRTFSRAAFLIKASRPENTFKLSSWTLNPSLLFTRLHRKEREGEKERKKKSKIFLSNQFPPLEHAKFMCMRANNAEREKKKQREKEGYIYFRKEKTSLYSFISENYRIKEKWKDTLFIFIYRSNITEYKQRSYYL